MIPLLVTPERRANWDRLRAENHAYYQAVLADGLRDNTAAPRYASNGRWSALARQMSGDPAVAVGQAAFSRRSYDHVLGTNPFETKAALDGNGLREHGIEYVVTLSWIANDLTEAEIAAWRDWLFRSADAFLLTTVRYNDSDQVVGTYFTLAALDRAFGSNYRAHPKAILMREAVRKFCTVLAKGGQWPEGSEYSQGTVNLLFSGAEAAGIEDYPEVVEYRNELIAFLPHTFVSDLKDTFEHEDEQTPHDPHWLALETTLAYLSQFSPEIRQFEIDLRAAWGRPAGVPFYPRYFIWANPYGPVAPWKTSTFAVSPGVGQIISRRGWERDDEAVFMWWPPYSLGMTDHDYGVFGEIRIRKAGAWTRDRPQAYSAALLLGNHTIIGGLTAPKEVGVFNGATRIGDRVTYGSGTNAGVFAIPGRYNPPATLLNEKTVSFVWLMDRGVVLKIERIHLTDTVDLARFAETVDDAKIIGSPLIETLWQSQTIMPVVTDGVILDDGRVQPLYPCIITVVDQRPLNLGTIKATEKGWYSSVKPLTIEKFQILVTLIGGPADVTIDRLGDVQRIRVTKAGVRDAVIYSSAQPGPVLMTTRVGNESAYDKTKVDGIQLARAVEVDLTWAEANADVYIEQADRLEQLTAPPPPPPPPVDTRLEEALAEIGRLVGEIAAQADVVAAERARAELAEGVVQQARDDWRNLARMLG